MATPEQRYDERLLAELSGPNIGWPPDSPDGYAPILGITEGYVTFGANEANQINWREPGHENDEREGAAKLYSLGVTYLGQYHKTHPISGDKMTYAVGGLTYNGAHPDLIDAGDSRPWDVVMVTGYAARYHPHSVRAEQAAQPALYIAAARIGHAVGASLDRDSVQFVFPRESRAPIWHYLGDAVLGGIRGMYPLIGPVRIREADEPDWLPLGSQPMY